MSGLVHLLLPFKHLRRMLAKFLRAPVIKKTINHHEVLEWQALSIWWAVNIWASWTGDWIHIFPDKFATAHLASLRSKRLIICKSHSSIHTFSTPLVIGASVIWLRVKGKQQESITVTLSGTWTHAAWTQVRQVSRSAISDSNVTFNCANQNFSLRMSDNLHNLVMSNYVFDIFFLFLFRN